jgi:hypothetical protein
MYSVALMICPAELAMPVGGLNKLHLRPNANARPQVLPAFMLENMPSLPFPARTE